jgi:hypothetical protein
MTYVLTGRRGRGPNELNTKYRHLNISVSFCSAKVGANPAADVTSLPCKPVITLTSPLLLTDRNLGFALAPLRETTWVNGAPQGRRSPVKGGFIHVVVGKTW